MSSSIQVTDQAAAAVAKDERVSLALMEARIAARYDFTIDKALGDMPVAENMHLDKMSVCLLVMKNGFKVIGKSAPASPENFNADLGRKFAYEDAIRQLWPLEGYLLCTRRYEGW